jgi:hypothetical protein
LTISTQFDEFIEAFLPPNAPDIQRRQLRIAFFAGAASAVRQITEIPCDPTPEKAPPRHKLIENIQATFAETMSEALDAKFKQ